jgi:hypothetical protein
MTGMDANLLQAFQFQVTACRNLGSPFTADVCEILAERLDETSRFGRRILGWPGDPFADALALRAAAGFHALKRAQRVPALVATYPPEPADHEALGAAIGAAIAAEDDFLHDWLDSPPQTNEVARSSVLLGGALMLAKRFGLPLAWHEIGASMGLNLDFDRYRYDLGSAHWGDPGSTVLIRSEWRGAAPDLTPPLHVASRAGCDIAPLDPGSQADRERLLAYVWADQSERLARAEAALDMAAAAPWRVERADAAAWTAAHLTTPPVPGRVRVLAHSVMWQYLPEPTRAAVRANIARAAELASPDAPFAWLRMEADGQRGSASVRLTSWPDGEEREIARADFHGRFVDWTAG